MTSIGSGHRRLVTGRGAAIVVGILFVVAVTACGNGDGDGGGGDPGGEASFVANIRDAVADVETELGGPQEYFEVTATPQLTNVFVAIDDATGAVPYVYLDGELQPPGPTISGVSGQTFTASAIAFDEDAALSGVQQELPTSTIDAFSVEGGPGGTVRYVVSVRSQQGGVLDVVVAPSGAVIEVDPI